MLESFPEPESELGPESVLKVQKRDLHENESCTIKFGLFEAINTIVAA